MKRFVSIGLALFAAVASPAAVAEVRFLSGTTSAPPAMIFNAAVTAWDQTPQAAIADGTNITSIPGGPGATSLTTSTNVTKHTIGGGWATWSHGYTGPVFSIDGYTGTSVTLTLPAGTKSFLLYAEPNPFQWVQIQASTNLGHSVVSSIDGKAGASLIAMCVTSDTSDVLSTVTLSSARNFAIGEFSSSANTCSPEVAVPTLSNVGLLIASLLLAGAAFPFLRRRLKG